MGAFLLLHHLSWDHVGKSPHASSLDGSVPLKENCLMPASSEVHCCSLALLALSFPLCSRPPSQVAVRLALSEDPPADSWVPGNRIDTPPGKERGACAGLCSEETDILQASNLDFLTSAVFCTLRLYWEWVFPCSFHARICDLHRSLFVESKKPFTLSFGLFPLLAFSFVKCLHVLYMGMCACTYALSWSLKHLNKELLPEARL